MILREIIVEKVRVSSFFLTLVSMLFLATNIYAADPLVVKHIDKSWDSKTVPKKGVCLRRGGDGFSPKIQISKIPENTAVLKLMFTDMNFGKEGGHGGIETSVNGKTEIVVPSFRDTLPKGFKGIKKHHCKPCRNIGGNDYYNGPCSPQRKHTYKVFIYAVSKNGKTLSKGNLTLGRY